MVWLNLLAAGLSVPRVTELGRREGLRVSGERLIKHYQRYQNEDDELIRLQ
jgi:hypothetical protein